MTQRFCLHFAPRRCHGRLCPETSRFKILPRKLPKSRRDEAAAIGITKAAAGSGGNTAEDAAPQASAADPHSEALTGAKACPRPPFVLPGEQEEGPPETQKSSGKSPARLRKAAERQRWCRGRSRERTQARKPRFSGFQMNPMDVTKPLPSTVGQPEHQVACPPVSPDDTTAPSNTQNVGVRGEFYETVDGCPTDAGFVCL